VPLAGTVAGAPPGALGFDANTVLTARSAAGLRDAGFAFCIRYLSRGMGQQGGDLTTSEAGLILDAGLALMPVQHVQAAGWVPTEALGKSLGQSAAANANEVGFPGGVNVWMDLEGIHNATPAADVIAYGNAWCDEVAGAGYLPGVYVGASAILSGDQLYWQLKTKHYWKSGSTVPDIPHRGYQLIQRIVHGDIIAGVEIDRDVTQTDLLGDTVQWLTRQVSPIVVAAEVGTATGFPARVAAIASGEWDLFGRQQFDLAGHQIHAGHHEGDDPFFRRVGLYWQAGVNDPTLDGRNDVPWSAAFISWVMRTAGAGTRFVYSPQHSVYISRAIRDLALQRTDAGYWCFRLGEQRPAPGDIVCWAREPDVDYDHQKSGLYKGHCDAVVEVRAGEVDVIGGNFGDSVSKRTFALDGNGFLRPVSAGGELLFGLMKCRIG
jgi:hypothetical protein